jgi:hypothetical protein
VGIANVGGEPCEFDGPEGVYVVRPGKTAVVDLAAGVPDFTLRVRSAAGTRIRLAGGAEPPRRTLGTR